jgi:hypothetical protein
MLNVVERVNEPLRSIVNDVRNAAGAVGSGSRRPQHGGSGEDDRKNTAKGGWKGVGHGKVP